MPLNNRAYLISRGEIGLSQALLTAGRKPRVLFDSTFWSTLSDIVDRSGTELARIIPKYLRATDRLGEGKNGILRKANQTHLFTFGGVLTGAFPFLKKDILYRDVFDRHEVEALCDAITEHYGRQISDECREFILKRGNGRAFRGIDKLLWMIGVM